MFKLNCNKESIDIAKYETITSGSRKVYQIEFTFSNDWDSIKTKKVIFSNFKDQYAVSGAIGVPLDGKTCVVPWEVCQIPNAQIFVGVYGIGEDGEILPTVWTTLGTVKRGVSDAADTTSREPTNTVYQDMLKCVDQCIEQLQGMAVEISKLQTELDEIKNNGVKTTDGDSGFAIPDGYAPFLVKVE